MRNGDFRGLVDARTRAPIVLKDPLNIGIVGNVIPKAAISKEARRSSTYEPLPNTSQRHFQFRHHRGQCHVPAEELSGPHRSRALQQGSALRPLRV
jgi:hypothetical protein